MTPPRASTSVSVDSIMLHRFRSRRPGSPVSDVVRAVVRRLGIAAVLVAAVAPSAQAQSTAARSALRASGAQGTALIGGNGLVFDGSSGRVFIPNRAPSVTTSLTVEAWVRPDGAFVNDGGIVTNGTDESPWSFTTVGDGRLHLIVNRSITSLGGTHFYSTGRLTLGAWQHVAVSVGGGGVRFYINGQPAGETAAGVTFNARGGLLVIGADYPINYDYFRGGIDEVRIWNTARTAQQVRESRNRVLPANSAGLTGFWDFEALEDLGALSSEGIGSPGVNDVRDRTAFAAHGELVGGVSLIATNYAVPVVRSTYDLYEDRVVLTWDRAASTTARHQILRDGLLLTTLSATDTTYTDRAGVAGRSYPYCVTRTDGASSTDLGCDNGRRQLLSAANVAASDGQFTDKVRITWADRSTVNTGYRVFRAGTLVATLGDVAAFDDTTTTALAPGVGYTFCVAPVQGAGEGPRTCDPGSRGSILPAATVRASDGTQPVSTLISWADQGTGATGFTVTRNGATLATVGGAARQYRDVTGAPGTVYAYCVVRQQGATSAAPACDAGAQGTMLTPAGVAASDSTRDDRVEVRWSNSASTETGYRIHRDGGYGLNFDGNDAVTARSFTQSPASGTLTAEAWVRPDAFGGAIVSKGSAWSLRTTPDGRLAASVTTANGPVQANSTLQLTLGRWQHVAVTMGGGAVRFYLDGVESNGAAPAEATFPASSQPLVIGSSWTGGIDEVRVWSTVRSQSVIRAAMYAAATGQEDGLMAVYNFDEGIGTLATDVRGGKHGVLTGFDGTATSGWAKASAPVAGQGVRPALRLDGAGGHAAVSGVALPSSFTVEFWARRDALGRADAAVGQGTTAPNGGLDVGFGADNRFALAVGGNALVSPAAFADLDWHHWAVTYDRASGTRTLLRDGVELTRDVAAAPYGGTGDVWIGRSITGGTFGGRLADVRVWNRARAAAAIGANRYALADTARAGLVGEWRFDALDASGTAAMTGAPGTSATGNPPSATLTGGALLTGAGRPRLAGLVPAGSTSFTDLTPEPGLRYTYCVSAYAAEGADTPAACDDGSRARAVAPAVVIASDGAFEDRVTIGWLGASTRAATYNVYRGHDPPRHPSRRALVVRRPRRRSDDRLHVLHRGLHERRHRIGAGVRRRQPPPQGADGGRDRQHARGPRGPDVGRQLGRRDRLPRHAPPRQALRPHPPDLRCGPEHPGEPGLRLQRRRAVHRRGVDPSDRHRRTADAALARRRRRARHDRRLLARRHQRLCHRQGVRCPRRGRRVQRNGAGRRVDARGDELRRQRAGRPLRQRRRSGPRDHRRVARRGHRPDSLRHAGHGPSRTDRRAAPLEDLPHRRRDPQHARAEHERRHARPRRRVVVRRGNGRLRDGCLADRQPLRARRRHMERTHRRWARGRADRRDRCQRDGLHRPHGRLGRPLRLRRHAGRRARHGRGRRGERAAHAEGTDGPPGDERTQRDERRARVDRQLGRRDAPVRHPPQRHRDDDVRGRPQHRRLHRRDGGAGHRVRVQRRRRQRVWQLHPERVRHRADRPAPGGVGERVGHVHRERGRDVGRCVGARDRLPRLPRRHAPHDDRRRRGHLHGRHGGGRHPLHVLRGDAARRDRGHARMRYRSAVQHDAAHDDAARTPHQPAHARVDRQRRPLRQAGGRAGRLRHRRRALQIHQRPGRRHLPQAQRHRVGRALGHGKHAGL